MALPTLLDQLLLLLMAQNGVPLGAQRKYINWLSSAGINDNPNFTVDGEIVGAIDVALDGLAIDGNGNAVIPAPGYTLTFSTGATGLESGVGFGAQVPGDGAFHDVITFPSMADDEIINVACLFTLRTSPGSRGFVDLRARDSAQELASGGLLFCAGGTTSAAVVDVGAPGTNGAPAGAAAQLLVRGSSIVLQVKATAAFYAKATWSVNRALAPGAVTLPTVLSVSPASGNVAGGTAVTLTGLHFLTPLPVTAVTLDGIAATSVVVVDDSHVTCHSGAASGNGTGDVHATSTAGGTPLTNGWSYTGGAGAAPSLTTFPRVFLPGATVKIVGTNLNAGGALTVHFGGGSSAVASSVTGTTASVVVPSGLSPLPTSYMITLSNSNGTSSAIGCYCLPPNGVGGPVIGFSADASYVTLGTGSAIASCTDLTGAITVTPSGTPPTLSTSAFGGGVPSFHHSGAGDELAYTTALANNTPPFAMISIAFLPTPASGAFSPLSDAANGAVVGIDNGMAFVAATGGLVTGASPGAGAHMIAGVIPASGPGSIQVDGGSASTGTTGSNNFVGGIVIGGDGTADIFPFAGDIGLNLFVPGGYAGPDFAILRGIAQNLYGTP